MPEENITTAPEVANANVAQDAETNAAPFNAEAFSNADINFSMPELPKVSFEDGKLVFDDSSSPLQAPDFTRSDAEVAAIVQQAQERYGTDNIPENLQQAINGYYQARQATQDAYDYHEGYRAGLSNDTETVLTNAKQKEGFAAGEGQRLEAESKIASTDAWTSKMLEETEKQKAAGWTKEDFLREALEGKNPEHDPDKVESHTVEEYEAIRRSHAGEPRLLPREATEINHSVMNFGPNSVMVADVASPVEAAKMIEFARENGVDCMCKLPNDVIIMSGDSPAMQSVTSDFRTIGAGYTAPFMGDNLATFVAGNPNEIVAAFTQNYATYSQLSQGVAQPAAPNTNINSVQLHDVSTPYTTMKVAHNTIVIASVQNGLDAEKLINAAKEQGADCVCQTARGNVVFGGDSPAINGVAEHFKEQGCRNITWQDGHKSPIIMGASPEDNMRAFESCYRDESLRQQAKEGGIVEKVGITYAKAQPMSREELVNISRVMAGDSEHSAAVRETEHGRYEVALPESQFSAELSDTYQNAKIMGTQDGITVFEFSSKNDVACFLNDANMDAMALDAREDSLSFNTDDIDITE